MSVLRGVSIKGQTNKLVLTRIQTANSHTADCPLTHHITHSTFDHINKIVNVKIAVFLLLVPLWFKL